MSKRCAKLGSKQFLYYITSLVNSKKEKRKLKKNRKKTDAFASNVDFNPSKHWDFSLSQRCILKF